MQVGFAILFGCTVSCIGRPEPRMGLATAPSPPTATQVSNCESTRTWHNIWTMTGTVFGGLAGASGAADSVTQDKNAQLGIGIGVATSGVIAAVAAAAAGIEADNYSTENCTVVLSAAATVADRK